MNPSAIHWLPLGRIQGMELALEASTYQQKHYSETSATLALFLVFLLFIQFLLMVFDFSFITYTKYHFMLSIQLTFLFFFV